MQKSIRSIILLLRRSGTGRQAPCSKRERARSAALAALCGVILSASVYALALSAEPSPSEIHTPSIMLVPGEDGGHFRFEIKGQEVAIIDKTGLHVRGDINYGAKLSHHGEQGFEDHAVSSGGQSYEV